MALRRGLSCMACACAVVAALLPSSPGASASATSEGPPWGQGVLSTTGNEFMLEDTMKPSDASTVTAGTTMVFSGQSQVPVTFAVASSPAALALPPDIAWGTGSVEG